MFLCYWNYIINFFEVFVCICRLFIILCFIFIYFLNLVIFNKIRKKNKYIKEIDVIVLFYLVIRLCFIIVEVWVIVSGVVVILVFMYGK